MFDCVILIITKFQIQRTWADHIAFTKDQDNWPFKGDQLENFSTNQHKPQISNPIKAITATIMLRNAN